jgi:HAD superfamily hydrolase (TIGR01509 family)
MSDEKGVKAILFDLDGVLVNMPNAHFEALNNALGLFGASITWEEHSNYFNGLPTRIKLVELEKMGRLPEGLGDVIDSAKQKYTKALIPKYCIPDYAKILMLKHLKASGYKLVCCSNSTRETLKLMLESAGIYNFFDTIFGNDDVSNPKPNPEIYLKAFEALKLKPQETLIIEDSPHGIMAAENSGAKLCKVKGYEEVNLDLFFRLGLC